MKSILLLVFAILVGIIGIVVVIGMVMNKDDNNNGQGLYFGGLAVESSIDQIAGNDNNIGGNVVGAIDVA